jgi:hypothetical protein
MAKRHLTAIRRVQPVGPYWLGGFCTSGPVAFEIARILQAQGEQGQLVVLIESAIYNTGSLPRLLHSVIRTWVRLRGLGPEESLMRFLSVKSCLNRIGQFRKHVSQGENSQRSSIGERFAWIWQGMRARLRRRTGSPAASSHRGRAGQEPSKLEEPVESPESRRRRVGGIRRVAVEGYVPGSYTGRVICLLAAEEDGRRLFDPQRWRAVARNLEIRVIPGGHNTCITTHCNELAKELSACLHEVEANEQHVPNASPRERDFTDKMAGMRV